MKRDNNYPPGALALENFWTKFPEHYLVKEFREVYDSDEDEDKFTSSTVMWGIHYVYSYESSFAHLRIEDRIEQVETNILFITDKGKILSGKGFFKNREKELKSIIDAFIKAQSSSPLRVLASYDEYLDIRADRLIEIAKSKTTTAKEIAEADALIAATQKTIDIRNNLYNSLHPDAKGRNKGGIVLSLAAANKIRSTPLNTNPYANEDIGERVYKQHRVNITVDE